jgi:hypothetical protein
MLRSTPDGQRLIAEYVRTATGHRLRTVQLFRSFRLPPSRTVLRHRYSEVAPPPGHNSAPCL